MLRRFQYHFRLAGYRVIMLHYIDEDVSDGDCDAATTADAPVARLHLVEVYERTRDAAFWTGRAVLVAAAATALWAFAR